MSDRPLRVAIASPGVGRVQRGYERFFSELFAVTRDEIDVCLFKGGGAQSAREKVPPFLHRNSRAIRNLPIHRLFGRTAFHTECLLFALGLLPYLRAGHFDVVHTIDPPLTKLLFHFRRVFGLRFSLLSTEGTGMAPTDYPPADFIHHVSPGLLEGALAHGYPPERMSFVPCGINPTRFTVAASRDTLRAQYGVPRDRFLILSIAALNRKQKRIDYLIDEMALLEGDWLLWLDGSLDHGDPDLPEYARTRLGDRVRISHVASEKVGELYAMSDLLAHTSLLESFGLAIVEAACTGLPVITDNGPHFQWLLPNPACWFDAKRPGALAAKIRRVIADRSELEKMRCAEPMLSRFAWRSLRPDYVDLYVRAAELGPTDVLRQSAALRQAA